MKGPLRCGWRTCILTACAIFAAISYGSSPPQSGKRHAITYDDLQGATDAYGAFALSQDGNVIAYVHGGNVYVKELVARTPVRKLGAGFSPKWSPDSTKLAFYSADTGSM